MKNFIEELFYGNIDPQARGYTKESVLSRKLNTYKYDLDMLGLNVEISRDTDRYVIIGKPENQKIAVDTDDIDDNFDIKI